MIVGVTSKVQLEPFLQDAMYAFGTSTVQLRLGAFLFHFIFYEKLSNGHLLH
jgi:hypothetical protein